MTPNFALSLSFEGIRLLRRVTGGWHLVGEVTLDTPDLGGALKVLRQTALELDPAGLRTKLLIPNEQIKYTAIDSTQTDLDDVHAALDGLTPYSIHDLVIDFDRTGGRTHIAAVARETLQEAESFALEHNFAPVCFAAIAPAFTFSGEVFFGPTNAANDILGAETPVARDTEAVVVIGSAAMPDPAPIADPTPVADDQPDAPLVLEAEVAEEDATAAVEILFASRNRQPVEAPAEIDAPVVEDSAPEPVKEPEPDVEPLFTRRKETPKDAASPRAEPPLTASKPTEPTPFTSIRASEGEDSVAPPVIVPAQAEPIEPTPPVVADPIVRPAPLPDRIDPPVAAKPAAEAETMTVFGARDAGKIGGKPKYLGLILTVALLIFMLLAALLVNTTTEGGIAGWFKSEPQLIEVTDVPTPVIQAPEETAAVEPTEEAPAPPVLRQPVGRVLSADEANRIYAATGVYQRAPRFTNVPRETSLDDFQEAAPVAPATMMAALAAPDLDAMFPDAPLTPPANPPAAGVEFPRDLRGFILATPEGTVTPEGALVIAGTPERVPPLRPGTEVVAPVPETVATVPEGEEGLILIAGRPPIVPPLRPSGIAPEEEAATVPDTPVEVIVETAEAAPLTPLDDDAAANIVADAIAAAERGDAAAAPAPEDVAAVVETPAIAPEPLVAPVVEAPEVAPETVEAIVPPAAETPDDVIILAGSPDIIPPLRPETLVVPEPIVTAPDETIAAETEGLIVLAGSPDIVPPLRPETLVVPVPAAPEPDVVPEEEDAEVTDPTTDEDVIVLAGSPDIVPPVRPSTIAARATTSLATVVVNPTDLLGNSGVALATFQPRQRPATLQPPVEEQVATLQVDPTLAGFRPAVRPAGLAPVETPEEVVAEPATPDVNSVIAALAAAAPPSPIVNATAQAITVSPRPGPRPRNFGQVVARAQAAAQQRQAAPQPAAAAPTTQVSSASVRPTGPVPGGVARAATVDNAIRLRDINLIGVYGRPSDRRALIRLGNGRYVKVEVGSRLDGGRVTAIGDSALNYVKSGRTYALQLPAG